VRLILVGFGNLGRALARILLQDGNPLQRRKIETSVVAIVDEKGGVIDERGLRLERVLEVAEKEGSVASLGQPGLSAVEVIRSLEADVVLELTPTNIRTGEPGLTHIKEAMNSGKHVVTSNKGPLVAAFRELTELAQRRGVQFRYSATVGGAIPVLSLAKRLCLGDRILAIRGVLNGTTNYILTRMEREGAPPGHCFEGGTGTWNSGKRPNFGFGRHRYCLQTRDFSEFHFRFECHSFGCEHNWNLQNNSRGTEVGKGGGIHRKVSRKC